MCTYPFMGALTDRFGIRRLASCGAVLALVGMLPLVYMAANGLVALLLVAGLFARGVGMSTIGIPSISSAYAAMSREDLPMATSAMNIVQRLGGPTLTTVVATFLAWRIGPSAAPARLWSAFTASFALLCGLHLLLFIASLRLPWAIER